MNKKISKQKNDIKKIKELITPDKEVSCSFCSWQGKVKSLKKVYLDKKKSTKDSSYLICCPKCKSNLGYKIDL